MNKLIIEVAEDSYGPWRVLESVEFEGPVPPDVADIIKKHGIKGNPYWEHYGNYTYDDCELEVSCRYCIIDANGKQWDGMDFCYKDDHNSDFYEDYGEILCLQNMKEYLRVFYGISKETLNKMSEEEIMDLYEEKS